MDPNQQPQPPQQPFQPQVTPPQFDPNQYDFIMSDPKKVKKPLIPLPSAGSGKKQRILFVVLASIIVLIVISLVYSLLTSGSKSTTNNVVSVVAQQNEIARVATLGSRKAGGPTAKNLASTIQLTMTTDQQALTAYLKKNGHKVSSKELATAHSALTDSQLATAETNGRFDDTFIQIMRDSLSAYQTKLKTANASAGKTGQALLSAQYDKATLLLTSANNAR